MSKYKCARCLKDFSQKCDYIRHINRKNMCPNISKTATQIKEIPTQKLKCEYCDKIFSRTDSLFRHKMSFCKVKTQNDEMLENKNKTIEKLKKDIEILKLENENYKELFTKHKLHLLESKKVKIIPLGKEDYDKLDGSEYIKIIERGFMCIPALIERLHFNEKIPEYHNVYIPQIREKYVTLFADEGWLVQKRLGEILEQLREEGTDVLEQKYKKCDEQIDKNKKKNFERYIDSRYDDNVIEKVDNNVKEMLYNKRNIVTELRHNNEKK